MSKSRKSLVAILAAALLPLAGCQTSKTYWSSPAAANSYNLMQIGAIGASGYANTPQERFALRSFSNAAAQEAQRVRNLPTDRETLKAQGRIYATSPGE